MLPLIFIIIYIAFCGSDAKLLLPAFPKKTTNPLHQPSDITSMFKYNYCVMQNKQQTCLQEIFLTLIEISCKDFCWAKTNQVDNSRLLQTLDVWQQDMSCLHPIRTCFFVSCTCLGATDGKLPIHCYNFMVVLS